MSERETVLLEYGYVLHERPYRNTSQLLECLTIGHGRVGLVARGSRRTKGGQRALLQPFAPLRLSWLRRGELGRLTGVEPHVGQLGAERATLHVETNQVAEGWQAGGPAGARLYGSEPGLAGERLLAGYYVNELTLRLSVRGDANDAVFSCYSRCLAELAAPSVRVARALRLFELDLLRALGYGLELKQDVETGKPLTAESRYRFELERGPSLDERASGHDGYWGHELIALDSRTLDDEVSLRAARRLLGRVLAGYLGTRPLKSREVLKEIIARGL